MTLLTNGLTHEGEESRADNTSAKRTLTSRAGGHLDLAAVPNCTRTPDGWFYIHSHYVASQQITSNVIGLRRDESRVQRINRIAEVISAMERQIRPTKRHQRLELGAIPWKGGADFIHLNLTVAHPMRCHLLKPSSLMIDLHFADNSHHYVPIFVRPGRRVSVWIFSRDERLLQRHFDEDASKWRSILRPVVTDFAMEVHPLDEVSVPPRSITIHCAEIVTLSDSTQAQPIQ